MTLRSLFGRPRPEEPSPWRALFALVYGGTPTEAEARLLEPLLHNESDPIGLIRRMIAALDRQSSATPFLVRMRAEDLRWVQLDGFGLAVDSADIAVGRQMTDGGVYEPNLSAMFRRSIRPGMVVADVGANVGYYSLLAAKLVGEGGGVLAFEPNSENCRLLLMSRARNRFEQIDLFPLALGKAAGHSFFSPFVGSNGGFLAGTEEVLASAQCVVIPTATLDETIEGRIDFIKIDVEGAEGLVLEGAQRTIRDHRPIITTEFSPEMLSRVSGVTPLDYLTRFVSQGYSIFLLDRGERAGEETPVPDPEGFLADYGSPVRIEDLAFRPNPI